MRRYREKESPTVGRVGSGCMLNIIKKFSKFQLRLIIFNVFLPLQISSLEMLAISLDQVLLICLFVAN